MLSEKSLMRTTAMRLLISSVASLLSLTVWATTPDKDPFYFAEVQSGGGPGSIIDVRESVFTQDPFFKSPVPGVNAWQIMYQSENATGESIAVSGTILVPKKDWNTGDRPIIGYSVGTRGLGDDCAPSYTLSEGYDYETPSIRTLLKEGWAVVISDYEGLGTPGNHTYMVGPSQGRVALDIIKAAQHLPETGLSPEAPIVLMGYSQGGAASGWALELANSYAPELNIVGAVLGGVLADIEASGRFVDGTLFTAIGLLASVGLDTAYENLDLAGRLNEKGLDLLSKSNRMCLVSPDDMKTKLDTFFRSFDDYALSNPVNDPLWQYHIGLSKLGSVAPTVPVYLFHGIFDQIVPFKPAAQLRKDWCDLGAVVEWHPTFDVHMTSLYDGALFATGWIADRFEGLDVSGNCSRRRR